MFISTWLLIIIACSIGYGITAIAIGGPRGDYDFGTGIMHVVALGGWIIVLLASMLIYNLTT